MQAFKIKKIKQKHERQHATSVT